MLIKSFHEQFSVNTCMRRAKATMELKSFAINTFVLIEMYWNWHLYELFALILWICWNKSNWNVTQFNKKELYKFLESTS